MHQKTTLITPEKANNSRARHSFDASGKILGRMATGIAVFLRGKHKPDYTTFIDCGDFVDVTNASQLRFTGNKLTQKHYFSHSGFAGGAKTTPLFRMMDEHPEKVVYLAVKRMLPDNRLRRKQMTRLRVYRNAKPGAAKQPITESQSSSGTKQSQSSPSKKEGR